MVLTDDFEAHSQRMPLFGSERHDSDVDDDTSFNHYIEGDNFQEQCSVHSSSHHEAPENALDEPEYRNDEEYIPEDVRPSWSWQASKPSSRSVRSALAQSPASVHAAAFALPASSFSPIINTPAVPLSSEVTSPQHQPSESLFHRCDEFFFEDANIVLVSDENFAFGVHRGVMKRLSTVFAHMFEDVQGTSDTEMFQGLPFVRLSDTTNDLSMFFEVIYDQRTIESIEAPHKRLLTFCDKYAVNSVLRKIVAYLLHSFPDTLKAWELVRDKGKTEAEEVMNVALAAYKMDMKILLPSCLYTIMIDSGPKSDAVEKLPKDLLVKYYRGLVNFSAYTADFYWDTLFRRVSPPKGCNKAKCKEIWSDFRTRVRDLYLNKPDYIRRPNPLRYLRELSELALTPHGEYCLYCDQCRAALPKIFENAAEEVWKSLPSTFGIANDWGILREKYLH